MAAEHPVLRDLFQQHQEALVSLLFVHALADLEEFARRLHRHIRVEEESLLPAYKALAGKARAGKAEYFLAEHRRIETELDGMLSAMRSLGFGPGSSRGVLALLEREVRFKSLLEHHELREEKFLFPRLLAAAGGPNGSPPR